MAKPFSGEYQARRTRLDAGLVGLPRRPGARGLTQRAGRALRRHRLRRMVAVRRPHQHADDAATGRHRSDLLAVAHDRAVLADPLDVPHRPQPPLERLRRRSPSPPPGSPATAPTSRRRTPRWPTSCATPAGRTFWVGKNHNVPIDEWTMGASKKNWPLGQGYDRFYGFIGGETNNWYPTWPRTTTTSTSRTSPRTATTCRRTSPTRRSA